MSRSIKEKWLVSTFLFVLILSIGDRAGDIIGANAFTFISSILLAVLFTAIDKKNRQEK